MKRFLLFLAATVLSLNLSAQLQRCGLPNYLPRLGENQSVRDTCNQITFEYNRSDNKFYAVGAVRLGYTPTGDSIYTSGGRTYRVSWKYARLLNTVKNAYMVADEGGTFFNESRIQRIAGYPTTLTGYKIGDKVLNTFTGATYTVTNTGVLSMTDGIADTSGFLLRQLTYPSGVTIIHSTGQMKVGGLLYNYDFVADCWNLLPGQNVATFSVFPAVYTPFTSTAASVRRTELTDQSTGIKYKGNQLTNQWEMIVTAREVAERTTLPNSAYTSDSAKIITMPNGSYLKPVIGSNVWKYKGEYNVTNDLLVNLDNGSAVIDFGEAIKIKTNGDRFIYNLATNAWIPAPPGYLLRTSGTMPTVSVTNATSTNEKEVVTQVFNTTDNKLYKWNGTAFVVEVTDSELSIASALPASLPKFGNQIILAVGGDTSKYTYIKTGVYKAEWIKSSTTPINTSNTDVEGAVWKNPISLTGKTVDFTYQNNRWFPTKGYVTPQDYDAKGDDVTDDLLAFRAMLKSNYPIVIPKGSYKVSDTLGVNRKGLDLAVNEVKITQTTADRGIFYVKQPNVIIRGFELISSFGTATSIYDAFAVTSTNARNLKIESNIIHGFGGGGMWLPNAPNAIIRDNLIYDCSSSVLQGEATDIYMWVGSEGAQIINNRCFSNSSQGIYNISGGNEFIVSGNQCTPKDPITFNTMDTTLIKRRHGIVVSYGNGVVKNVSITNNIISNTNWTGIYFTGSDSTYNVLISGNVLSRNGLLAGNTLSGGIAVFSQPKSLLISNNTIDEYKNIDPLVGGITFQPGNISSTLSDSTSCTITSNVVRNSTRGLSLGNRATNVIVSNNTFKDFTKGGIDISTVTSTTFVGGYIISNNTFETVSRLGTTGMIKADLQASTKIVELYSNHFRTLGTIKDTGIVSNYWSKIKLVGNDFTNLTTACYSGGYISTSLNKDLNNTFKDCTNAYDISAASLGAGYYYYKNAYFENVTNIFTNTIGSRAVFDKLYNFQEINSGTTITQLESTTNLNIDGYSVLSSMAVTLKSAPVDGDVLTVIVGLGYTTAGSTAITGALTFINGFVYGDIIPNNVLSGSRIGLTYSSSVNRWNLKYSPYHNFITGSVAFNSAITTGTEGTATATITGAAVGDVFSYSLGTTDLPTGVVVKSVRVTAANTVVVTLLNTTGSTQTPNITIYLKR